MPREPFALTLSDAEAERWSARIHLAGHDGWVPQAEFAPPLAAEAGDGWASRTQDFAAGESAGAGTRRPS